MNSTMFRINALKKFFADRTAEEAVFVLEDGQEFKTSLDPWEYLVKYGAYTPEGKRIVKYPHPVEGIDALSLSLYELIDEAILRGKVEFPVLESDEL